MRLPYVTYRQAKELKDIGFDEYCGSSYIGGELCHGIGWKASWNFGPEYGFNKDSKPKEQIPAPMYVEVLEWARSQKEIICEINFNPDKQLYWHSGWRKGYYRIWDDDEDDKWYDWTDLEYRGYKETLSELTDKVISLVNNEIL